MNMQKQWTPDPKRAKFKPIEETLLGGPVQPLSVDPSQTPMQQPAGPTLAEQALAAPSEMDAQDKAPAIGKAQVDKAYATWEKYKDGRATLTKRITTNEEWWRLRHTDNPIDPANKDTNSMQKTSAWLVNCLLNKHADAMDNYPEASILPREQSDEQAAQILSEVLPVLLQQNKFESVWSDSWWRKIKFGAAVYGVYWNGQKQNGIGDLDIKSINLLSLYWEPGIKNIQDSANVFHVEYWDNRTLELAYPQLAGKIGSVQELPEHKADDTTTDINSRSMVFDWYYKGMVGTQTVVHLCRFACGQVLFSSENEKAKYPQGFYAHGKYPFVVDNLFPIETELVGFGYLDIMKSAQEHIDALGADIAMNTRERAKTRFLVPDGSDINETELADYTKAFIHYTGTLDMNKFKEFKPEALGADVFNWYNAIIDELKETSGNQDVNTGAKPSGITAASAIAALQEAGSKLSRDMLKASYWSIGEVYELSIETIRQFYGVGRYFRVTSPNGTAYPKLDNSMLNPASDLLGGRTPYFDIDIKPQRANPYSKMAQNERMLQFYQAGLFNPANADQAYICIKHTDMDDKQELLQDIQRNGMMMQALQNIMSLVPMLPPDIGAAIVGAAGPNFAAVVPQMPAQQQGGSQTKTNSLGGIQPANAIADRVKTEVASRSDPNGGKA
jgi:hypothetical protein